MFFDIRKIIHLNDFVKEDLLNSLYNNAVKADKIPATVGKIINGKYTTEYHDWCTAKFVQYVNFESEVNLVISKIKSSIEDLYKVNCIGQPEIHFLHYETGTFYKSHIDGQYIENDYAKRAIDRDLTAVLYLNDDYEGGEVNFDFFRTTIKPKMNDLLIYPTTLQYRHSVSKVNGSRYAIVFWFKTFPELNVDIKVPFSVLQSLNNI